MEQQHIQILIELLADKAKRSAKAFVAALNKTGKTAKITGSSMSILRKQISLSGAAMKLASAGLSVFRRGVNKLKVALFSLRGALVFLGAFVMARRAITTIAEFGEEMSTVKAITQATNEEFRALQDTAKHLGSTTRFSAREAASGMVELARAGLTTQQIIKVTGNVLTLAQAGALDLGTAARLTGTALKVFKLGADQAGMVVDTLAVAANSALTDVNDLGEAFKFSAVAAKSAGLSFQETTAALTVLADAGLRGSAGGTAFRSVITKLVKPSHQAEKALKGMGLTAADVNVEVHGLVPVLELLAKKGVNLNKALQLFEIRGGPAFLSLTENIPALKEMIAKLDAGRDAAERIAWEMDNNVGGALKAVKSAIEGVVLAMGDSETAGGTLKVLLKVLADAIRSLNDEGSSFGEFLSSALNGAAVAAAYLIDTFRGLKMLFLALKIGFNAFAAVMSKGVDAIIVLWQSFKISLLKLKLIAQKLISPFASFFDFVTLGLAKMMNGIMKALASIRETAIGRTIVSEKLINTVQKTTLALYKMKGANAAQSAQDQKDTQKKIDQEALVFDALTKRKNVEAEGFKIQQKQAQQELKALAKEESAVSALGRLQAYYANERDKPVTSKAKRTKIQAVDTKTLLADFDLGQADAYKQGEAAWQQYWDQRLVIMKSSLKEEADLLAKQAAAETDPVKQRELLKKRIETDKELRSVDAKNAADKAKADTKYAVQADNIDTFFAGKKREREIQDMSDTEAQYARASDALKQKQDKEYQFLVDNNANKEELDTLDKQQQNERDRLATDKKEALAKELADKEQMTRDKVFSYTQGALQATEDAFGAMYEATGKKVKAFFFIQKAAAIAQTIMTTYEGAAKAVTEWTGLFPGSTAIGIAQAAVVVAGGLAKVAMIAGLSLAKGGKVGGSSPSDTADNIPAMLTAGEYVQPVDTVRHYGASVMEGLRNRTIPRSIFQGLQLPSGVPLAGQLAFATGGSVGQGQRNLEKATSKVGASGGTTINNIVDTSMIDQHLLSPAGQEVIMNVMTNNQFELDLLTREED